MSEMVKIDIPKSDPMYVNFRFIEHSRSKKVEGTGANKIPRNHMNEITSCLDGSAVYGSDDERAHILRAYKDGKMKVTKKAAGDILPYNLDDIMNAGGSHRQDFFLAGDIRVNEQTGLSAIHTIWVREHNRFLVLFLLQIMTYTKTKLKNIDYVM